MAQRSSSVVLGYASQVMPVQVYASMRQRVPILAQNLSKSRVTTRHTRCSCTLCAQIERYQCERLPLGGTSFFAKLNQSL